MASSRRQIASAVFDNVRRLYQYQAVLFLSEVTPCTVTLSIPSPVPPRSARLGLRATLPQEAVLRRAADVAHKSLTDYIQDSACRAAEQTLIEQRLFTVSGQRYEDFMALLDRPEHDSAGLRGLLSRPTPWATT